MDILCLVGGGVTGALLISLLVHHIRVHWACSSGTKAYMWPVISLICRISRCEIYRWSIECVWISGSLVGGWTMVFIDIRRRIDYETDTGIEIDIQVCTEVDLIIHDVTIEWVERIWLEHTLIPIVVYRSIILHYSWTATDCDSGTMVDTVVFEKDIVPIIGWIDPWRIAIGACTADSLHAVFRCSWVRASYYGLIIHLHVGNRIHYIDGLSRFWHDHLIASGGIYAAFTTLLCGNKDYAISTAGTIHGCSGSIFQHTEWLNIFDHEAWEFELWWLYSVDKDKRIGVCAGLEWCDTTYIELGIHLFFCEWTYKSASLPCYHARDFTCKRSGEVTAWGLEVLGIDWCDGWNDALLLLWTECYYGHFVQVAAFWLKANAELCLSFDRHLLCLISDERESEDVIWLCLDVVMSIKVGHDTCLSSVNLYGHSGKRRTIFVHHLTLHFDWFLPGMIKRLLFRLLDLLLSDGDKLSIHGESKGKIAQYLLHCFPNACGMDGTCKSQAF